MRRLKTVRRPPIYPKTPGHLLCSSLTHPLPLSSRRPSVSFGGFGLNEVVLDTHKLLRRLIGTNIELVTMAAPNLGLVRVDPGQAEQVLINLAINARDATAKGGKLTIETYNATIDQEYRPPGAETPPGEYVVLAVSDNGVGMTEEVKARVFEPFFTTKEQGMGTGLGLSTCYGIVTQHGGRISVYSELGKGTTFRIYFPRVESVAANSRRGAYAKVLPRGREMVLLVDDEETVRGMAASVLRGQGYTVL